MQSFLREDEARAAVLGSKKKVVAMAEGRQYTIIEVRDDPETRWLRMVGEDVSVKDRLFLKIGSVSAEEKEHTKRAKEAWAKPQGTRFALFTVPASQVLLALEEAGKKTAYIQKVREVLFEQ